MHKISVIIPVYNAELYLSKCLDSILQQYYENLEIILVDDGCTDSCPKICDEYAEKDNRIKVIHQQNGGLSDARNTGLKLATGDYISFVDNDDLLSVYFYERLIQVATKNNADIVECDFKKFVDAEDYNEKNLKPQMVVDIFDTQNALNLLIGDYLQPMVWNKIYRKKVLINLDFPVGKSHEDVFWTYQAFGNANKIVHLKEVLYFYRQHDQSIMGKKYSLQRLDAVEALEERIYYIKEKFPKLESVATKVFCFGAMDHYRSIYDNQAIDPQHTHRQGIVQKVKNYNKYSVLKNWDLKTIFWFEFFLLSPVTSLKFRKFINKARNLE